MKLVCVADVHLHPRKLLSRDGGHDRLVDGLDVLRQSLQAARNLGATWVMAGDFKEPKTSWPQSALTGAHEILRAFDDVYKIMVAGNHDAEGIGGSGLSPFKDVAWIVDKASVVGLDPDGHGKDGTLAVCAPWNADRAEVARLVNDGLRGRKDRGLPLIAHAFLEGCMLGPEDARIAKGVPLEEYGNFSFAVFGDVHKGQWRRPGRPDKGRPAEWIAYSSAQVRESAAKTGQKWGGEVFYCGSPYQQNWGERNDPRKGALVVDTETGEVELHELKAPLYHHLELDEDGLRTFAGTKVHQAYEGGFVRVVYTGKPTADLARLRELEQSGMFRSLQVIPRRAQEKSAARAEVHAGMPMPDLLRNYMEARPVPEGVDKKRTLEALLRLTGYSKA